MKIEAQNGESRRGEAFGEVPESDERTKRLVPDRVAKDDAGAARRIRCRSMEPPEE